VTTATERKRIVVCCETPLDCQSLAWGLECFLTECDISHADSSEELVRQLRLDDPQLIVLDEQMALKASRSLSDHVSVRMSECRLAVIYDGLTQRQLDYVLQNRVSALLRRDCSLAEFTKSIEAALNGEPLIPAEVGYRVHVGPRGYLEVSQDLGAHLTDRQLDVLIRIAKGLSVKQVAQELRISTKSVESHKYRIMKSLAIDDRVDLCRWAIREGLIRA